VLLGYFIYLREICIICEAMVDIESIVDQIYRQPFFEGLLNPFLNESLDKLAAAVRCSPKVTSDDIYIVSMALSQVSPFLFLLIEALLLICSSFLKPPLFLYIKLKAATSTKICIDL